MSAATSTRPPSKAFDMLREGTEGCTLFFLEALTHFIVVGEAEALYVYIGFGYVHDWSAQNFVQAVRGQFQPCTSAQRPTRPQS